MNLLFKKEFMSLNGYDLANLINKTAGTKLIDRTPVRKNSINDPYRYRVFYVEDDNYGYWCIEWDWKQRPKVKDEEGYIFKGYFQNKIIIEPFKIKACYIKNNNQPLLFEEKQLSKVIKNYIESNCDHYKEVFEIKHGFTF